jgi:hypothetical protein
MFVLAEATNSLDIQASDTGMHLIGWLPEGVDDENFRCKCGVDGLFSRKVRQLIGIKTT